MIGRAIKAKMPFAWVTGDTVYGVSEIEMALRQAGKGYVLGVSSDSQFKSWIGKLPVAGTAKTIMQALEASAWRCLLAGEGTKGARLYDWSYLDWPISIPRHMTPTKADCGRVVG